MATAIGIHGLSTAIDGVQHLVGARCNTCATHAFPFQSTCPRCGADTSALPLPRDGSVWSWTVQRIRPKPPFAGPDEFEPFAVGYVDLGPLKVEARLVGRTADEWAIGTTVHLAVGVADAEGNHWDYCFEADVK